MIPHFIQTMLGHHVYNFRIASLSNGSKSSHLGHQALATMVGISFQSMMTLACRALKSPTLGVRITHLSHFILLHAKRKQSHAFLTYCYLPNGVATGSMESNCPYFCQRVILSSRNSYKIKARDSSLKFFFLYCSVL